jgi:hypothetical protein
MSYSLTRNIGKFSFILLLGNMLSAPLEIPLVYKNVTKYYYPETIQKTNKEEVFSEIPMTPKVLSDELLTLTMSFGTEPQEFNLIYDTGSFVTWVKGERFNEQDSTTYSNTKKKKSIVYGTGSSEGSLVKDTLSFNNSTVKDFSWMLSTNAKFDITGADGIAGFGRRFRDQEIKENYSVIHQLKEKGLIDKKIISQKYTNDSYLEANMYVGDIHTDFKTTSLGSGDCKCLNSDPVFSRMSVKDLWTCRMSYLIIGDPNNFKGNAQKYHIRATIDSGSNFMTFPTDPFKKKFDEYFINRQKCNYGKYWYSCPLTAKDPEIYFVLNGYALKMRYQIEGARKYFKVTFDNNWDIVLLGQFFMKDFHVLYDWEENKVKFTPLFGENMMINVRDYTTDNDFIFSDYWILWLCLGIGLLLVLIIIAYCCYKKKLRQTTPTTANYQAFYAKKYGDISA